MTDQTTSQHRPATGKGSAAPGRAPSRRAKGEKTRRKILTATIAVIAREGIRGVTHRAVAAEAGVQLSLTTYYFKDIEALIKEAFEQFSRRMRPDLQRLWSDIFTYLDGFSAAQLRLIANRQQICERLATHAADYIHTQITRKPEGLVVEQIFFTEARLSLELRELGAEHRRQLLQPFVRLCAYFNRHDPTTDAELLLAAITTLEYQGVSRPRTETERQRIHALVRRQVGWVLGLPRAKQI